MRQPICGGSSRLAAETARYVPAPAHLPVHARHRENPCNRNDDTRTRITDQANTLNATVIARSAATWQSPGREMSETNTRQPARPRWLPAQKHLPRSGSPSKHSPAVAHRRAKRTEWRMRGIEPNNKIIVVFPSSVLPSRCYGNPPSPEGEGLTGHIHVVISSVSREIPYNRNGTLHIRTSLPAGGGSPPKYPLRKER